MPRLRGRLPVPSDRADLHTHTIASDGALLPAQLVELARQRGLAAIAITDHDTVAGVAPALAAAGDALEVVPGVELSCREGDADVHLLGYGIDIRHPELVELLAARQAGRRERALVIIERLDALGVGVAMERVEHFAAGGSIGRPHIARALVEAKHVASVGDAFARYLASSAVAYVAYAPLPPVDAIAVIHRVAGSAVIAHPLFTDGYETLVPALAAAGLDGIEVIYPDHSAATRQRLAALARHFDLIATGGSDFHADTGRRGRALGESTVPVAVIDQLRERAAARAARLAS